MSLLAANRGMQLLLRITCLLLPLICALLPTTISALSSPVPAKDIGNKVRLVTWNLLAPCFSHPKKYPWCPPEYLDWPYRGQLVQSELERIDADIVCLQEIQTDIWDDFMAGMDDQYEGILQNVTNDHPVTNAILLRKDKFRVTKQESRSRALILVLEHQCDNDTTDNANDEAIPRSPPLYLANVHLQAGMDDDETRVCQLKSLLKRLVFHSKEDASASGKPSKSLLKRLAKRGVAFSSDGDAPSKETNSKANASSKTNPPKKLPPAVVIAGDMNMLPTNPVYRWLGHKEHETASSTSATQQAPKVNMRDGGTGIELTDLKFPSRGKFVELLPLTDVYRHQPPVLLQQTTTTTDEVEGQPVQMTYCGGSVLDYIWTTTSAAADSATSLHSIDISKTMVFHPQAFKNERQQWPSKDHPSDHIPIGFEFSWH